MGALRQPMIDAMQVRGMAVRTQEASVDALARMARHFGCSPAQLQPAQIESYMLNLSRDLGRSFSTINQVASASRFLFRHVLQREDKGLEPPVARTPQRQPELLSRAQISQLLGCCYNPMMQMLQIGRLKLCRGDPLTLCSASMDDLAVRETPIRRPASSSDRWRNACFVMRDV